MVRIFLLTLLISLTVGAFPALAEKQYKKSCAEFCATKVCVYGKSARWDLTCNTKCGSNCIMMRDNGTWGNWKRGKDIR